MSKIKILSENLANQIAAGEVVERPASVVKECVENAVDAGASQVDVEVEGNGTRLIRICDNGEGMDGDDVLLCLERHATSKLRSREDLAAIRSLGFRGEAIPSIASVSKFTITSRPVAAPLGMRAEVRFGKLVRAHEMGCPPGTILEVRDLFGNVPARRKFLKSTKTEISHIEETMVHCALARPALGIRLQINDRQLLNLPSGVDDAEGRVRYFFKKDAGAPLIAVASQLTPALGESPENHVQICGYLLPPEDSFGVSARLHLFVNHRAVRDRMLARAVHEGMQGFLLKGRRPAGVLFVSLPAELIDVNVHPTKQEVRFRREAEVRSLVSAEVRTAMERYQNELRYAVFGPAEAEKSTPAGKILPGLISPGLAAGDTPPGLLIAEPFLPYGKAEGGNDTGEQTSTGLEESPQGAWEGPGNSGQTMQRPLRERFSQSAEQKVVDADSRHSRHQEPGETFAHYRLIGQVLHSFILCEVEDGLVAIDQHAVQERILFETLKEGYFNRGIPRQALLFPKMLELKPAVATVLRQHSEEVARLGLDIEEFGGDSFVVKAVPALMTHLPPEEVVQGILSRFSEQMEDGQGRAAFRAEDMLASLACKAAIKGGQRLGQEEMENLLMKILESPVFSHCPHGRPVMKHFSGEEIKRWFHRT